MSIRKLIFWIHLIAGLVAGLVIFIMSFTGVVLAFEKEIVAWVDREALRAKPPSPFAERLSLDELIARVSATNTGGQPASVVVQDDPGAAVAVSIGGRTLYADPYTAETRTAGAARTRAFMSSMRLWHRYVAMSGESRTTGKMIAGACNFAFLGLAITGLYIWWPRKWNWRALKPSVWFVGSKGKARDWNWHNVIGLWSAPVLIVLTATALPISYSWVTGLISRLDDTQAPVPEAAPRASTPAPGTERANIQTLLAAVQHEIPDWKQITLRLDGGAGGRGGGRGGSPAGGPRFGNASEPAAKRQTASRGVSPITATVREHGSWPRTSNTTLSLNPFTGSTLGREGYADLTPSRQVRAWTRFLHTGEALGPAGQFFAGLASLAGCFLVWTGFALSWRRFFRKRSRPVAAVVYVREVEVQDAVEVPSSGPKSSGN